MKRLIDPDAVLIPACEVARGYQRLIPGLSWQKAELLAGTDAERREALEFCERLGALLSQEPITLVTQKVHSFKDMRQEDRLAGKLMHIKRAQAHQVLALFPMPIVGFKNSNYPGDLTYRNISPCYESIATWLINWDLELGLDAQLMNTHMGRMANLARLIQLRWNVAQGVHIAAGVGGEMTPSLIWLMAEASRCVSDYSVASNKRPAKNRKELFDSGKAYTDALKNACSSFVVFENEVQWMRSFHEILEANAAEYAKKSSEFNKQIFKPMLSARRKWDRDIYNGHSNGQKLNMYIEPPKPGPKPGQAWKKVTPSNAKSAKAFKSRRSKRKKDLPQN